jgi:stress response protein SCP2
MLDTAFIRIINSETKKEVLRFDLNLDSLSGYAGVIVGRLVRSHSGWSFMAVGQAHQEFGSMLSIASESLPTL